MVKLASRPQLDDLSWSSDDDAVVVSKKTHRYVLDDDDDSSSEDEAPSHTSDRKYPAVKHEIDSLSNALSTINIDSNVKKEKVKDRRPTQTPTKLDLDWLDNSSDDSSLEDFHSRYKAKNGDRKASSSNKPPSGPWRFSISEKEYAVTEVSDGNLNSFRIPGPLYEKLYDFQKEGVAWLAGLHGEGIGGLLG